MTDQIREPLPEALMQTVRLVLADGGGRGGMTREARLNAVLLIVHGHGLFVRETQGDGRIDSTAFAIPEPQWSEIAQGLIDMGGGDLTGVNAGLDWVNVGPSAYEPEPAR